MARVFTIGETVYDIIFKNHQPVAAKAGGSMLNTSVSLGRLGIDVSFISDLGKDEIGNTIIDFLQSNGITTEHIQQYESRKTGIAIAFLNENNDASYTFYKDFPENRLAFVNPEFEEGDIFLFGSFFALTASLRPIILKLVKKAREAGCIIIYDPNFRKAHLHELETLKPFILENIAYSDLVRGSDEDFELIFGAGNANEAFEFLIQFGCENLIYTANRNEVLMMSRDFKVTSEVPVIQPVSTIGAGDSFNAGIIWTLFQNEITSKDMEHLSERMMEKMIKNGISFSSEVCMSYENYISQEFASKLI